MERWAYEDVLAFVQSWDAVYFLALFAIAAVYAYWPRNKETFQRAARMPLEDESPL